MASLPDPGAAPGTGRESSSFRDPAGFLFWHEGRIRRAMRHSWRRHYEAAVSSGLFAECEADGLLLPFVEVGMEPVPDGCFAVLDPEQLAFISYPYEWSFDQLRDAALLTLELQLRALRHGLVLKDASAYNVQLVKGRPCFIDHLSFALLSDYGMWPAYGQFCRHFLAPLALMSARDTGLGRLLLLHLDGIPLPLASSLLPVWTWLNPGLLMHLHVHGRFVKRYEGSRTKTGGGGLSARQLSGIAESLRAVVSKLGSGQRTTWGNYYAANTYRDESATEKMRTVREMVETVRPGVLWDVGGNDGRFAREVADCAGYILCLDADSNAVNRNYQECRRLGKANVAPLLVDFSNPTPGAGFAGSERPAIFARSRPDMIMMLALVHHLAITDHIPLPDLAGQLATLAPHLLIEFVDRADPQVELLLLNRADIFDGYTETGFRDAFARHFEIRRTVPIPGMKRTLYLMRRRG